MKDQFIAGSTTKALRVKLIGWKDTGTEIHRYIEMAKCFEATTYTNQLMKTARGNQEQVNFVGKQRVKKETVKQSELPCSWCSGNHKEP